MSELFHVIKEHDVEAVIIDGMEKLVGTDKALESWDKLVKWRFKINYRATGRIGQCSHSKKEIQLSNIMFKSEHAVKRRNTLLHEIAHAVNPMLYGTCDGHGPNWRRIMLAFGERPERCNANKAISSEMMKKRKAKAKMIWACGRCEVEIPILRKRRRPAGAYSHSHCGGQLYVKRGADGRLRHNPLKE